MLLVGASACAAVPRDPDGTLERVREARTFSVGVIAPGPHATDRRHHEAFLDGVSRRTNASPAVTVGAAERLLSELEAGRLDLVIGELAERSPWREHVTMLPPLRAAAHGEAATVLAVAGRHGENAWLAVLFDEVTRINGAAR
ncbi:MAG TPA: hypothetical protein VMF13_08790 [Luteitalea sp.]|nr:hypothetical protein [Luteitalea sp.]